MSAAILPFPAVGAKAEGPPAPVRACVVGDQVLLCVNAALGLWCAWPVAVVDDDGVVLGVLSPAGKMIGADRISCDPSCFGLAKADHDPEAFAALRWKTWRDVGDALMTFAAVAVAPCR